MLCGSCAANHGMYAGIFCAAILAPEEHISDIAEKLNVPEKTIARAARAFVEQVVPEGEAE